MDILKPHTTNKGINTWDNGRCDLRLHLLGSEVPFNDQVELYCIMGDTWVITVDSDDLHVCLRQMTLEQAVESVRRRLEGGWKILPGAYPMNHVIRLFQIAPEWLPHDNR